MLRLLCSTTLAAALAVPALAQELIYPIGEDARFSWDSLAPIEAMDLSGQTVSVIGPWLGPDKETVQNVLAYFEAATGIEVDYAGSDSFEQQIVIDVQAGSPANVAVFPQPGLAADIASKGGLAPLGDATRQWVIDNYAAGQSWVDLGTYAGKDGAKDFYGFFYKVDVKSLVWYSPDNFADAGYERPETMEELIALTEQIAADGETPWCIGLGSGDATGWPATDWVEDILLRTQPPEVYDQWVTNEIPFDDPRIVAAIDIFGFFAKNDAFVDGGVASVGATDFRDSPKGLFAIPPRCYLHRQASFIPAFFPADAVVGEDVDFFYFPAYAQKDFGRPVLGAGTLWAITKDSPGARALIEFLKTPLAHELWMAQGGLLTPLKSVNTDLYASEALRGQGAILLNATTFRFDGSDLMPGAVGAGSFWTGMVDFVGGASAEEAAAAVQASWDAIK